MRGVLADDVTAAALDAGILIDLGLGDIVEVEVLPVGDIRHGAAGDVVEVAVTLGIHPVGKAGDHFLDNLEAVGHRRGADLHVTGAKHQEFGRVAPGGYATDAGDRQAIGFGIAGDFGDHVECDRLDRRAAIAAMSALAADRRVRGEVVEID
ncbi:hypothetical protein D9M70_589880 [compost metagenome]